MSNMIYQEPLYYEIAFSFINPKKQVDLFEKIIARHGKIKVNRVLDLGCGPSLQLREFARRGYSAIGLDKSPKMLCYLKNKAAQENLKIKTVRADMINFKLPQTVDLAFNLMGTISYCKNNQEFLSHLDSVAQALKKGGLYIMENFRLDWSQKLFKPQSWTMKRNKTKVKTKYVIKIKDCLNQLLDERMTFEVSDQGRKKILSEQITTKIIFPQEFLLLVKLNNQFEFVDWYERNRLQSLIRAKNDNLIILRRK